VENIPKKGILRIKCIYEKTGTNCGKVETLLLFAIPEKEYLVLSLIKYVEISTYQNGQKTLRQRSNAMANVRGIMADMIEEGTI
jgi:hypothetical protein